MLKVDTIKTRLTTDISFFSPIMPYRNHSPNEFIPHWWATYRDTGKLVFLKEILSDDSLIQYSTLTWKDRQTYNEAMSDPIVVSYYEALYAYNNANNIIYQGPNFSEI
jgi:hypothetical protein